MNTPLWNGPDTNRERKPMTPEQLDALRPKPVSEHPVGTEAKRIAYQAGVSALEGIILRIEELERKVSMLEAEWVNAAAAPKV
jgi:hypothetical protein